MYKLTLPILAILIVILIYITLKFKESFSGSGDGDGKENDNKIPKKIWTFWHDNEENAPEIVKLSYKSMKKLNPDYKFYQINFSNYKEYVDDVRIINIIENPLVIINHKSDLLRLYLVNKYGGIYFDSSILLLKPLDWIMKEYSGDIIMFKNSNHTTNDKYPVLENWFIASKPNTDFNTIVMELFIEMLSNTDTLPYEFMKLKNDLYVDYQNFKNHNIYYLMYFINIYVQFRYNIKTKIDFLDFKNHYFMFIYKPEECPKFSSLFYKKIDDKLFKFLLNNKFIKLTKDMRECISNFTYVKDSFIDRFIKYID